MSKMLKTVLISGLLLSALGTAQAAEGDATRGQMIFQSSCGTCHSTTANKIGPVLGGVFGRKAGTAAGYTNYSNAVKNSAVVWKEDTLEQWLSGPQKFLTGAKMMFNVPDPQKRADIIAYLKTLAAK